MIPLCVRAHTQTPGRFGLNERSHTGANSRAHVCTHTKRQTQSEQGLAKSRSLTSLNLSGNLLVKMTCWELKLSLMKNRTLRTLNLECNQVPGKKLQTCHAAIIMLANVGDSGLT